MGDKMETKNSLKTLKFRNRKLVLSFMRGAGAVSVNEISRATGLSKMTVHKIVDHYMKEGMIAFAGKGVSTEEGGKKPNLFSFNAHCRFLFAVRIGLGFVACSMVNLKGEIIAGRKTLSTDGQSFADTMANVGTCFHALLEEGFLATENCLAAVVGCNGIVDVDSGVVMASYQHRTWGLNIPLGESLAKVLPVGVTVYVDSWWRHMAHGEIHFAENNERNRFFLMGNSGDCVSGGFVDHGRVCAGASGFAGEIGHIVVAPGHDEVCVCGGRGCLESLVAPSQVVKKAVAGRASYPDSRIFAECGAERTPSFQAICLAADTCDALARAVLDEVIGHFAVAINSIVHICDPGRVVLLGDYATAGSYFLNSLARRIGETSLHGIDKRTIIECSRLSDDHGVIGAASMMTDTMFAGGR